MQIIRNKLYITNDERTVFIFDQPRYHKTKGKVYKGILVETNRILLWKENGKFIGHGYHDEPIVYNDLDIVEEVNEN